MTETDLWLKAENLQKTGSFKARGAINTLGTLSPEERSRGVVAVSAGNHGAALAYAARMVGACAAVIMPETATRSKIAAIEGYGAEAMLVPGDRLMESMEEIRNERGAVFVHPFDHPSVIAGAGTVGLEILEDLPDVEVVVVPVGGGGLISGIAIAIMTLHPETMVIGVEPEGSNVVSQSLAAGRPLRLESYASIADGLNAPWSAPFSLAIIQRAVDRVVTVPDSQIARAMRLTLERTKLVVEPAGAAAIAGLLSGLIPEATGKRAVAILSGGNVDVSRISELTAATNTADIRSVGRV